MVINDSESTSFDEPSVDEPSVEDLTADEPSVDDLGDLPVDEPPVANHPAAGRLTGDHAVDDVLTQLDQAGGEPLDVQIEVAERVQRVLQGRLADLGRE